MIRLWLGAALAAASAFADSPADYRSSAPVTPSGSDALHRVTLPFEAYRDTRRDFAEGVARGAARRGTADLSDQRGSRRARDQRQESRRRGAQQ